METERWPDESMRITFLTEGPDTPLPPPGKTQTTYKFPKGTRITQFGWIGFLVAHEDYPAMWIPIETFTPQKAPAQFLAERFENTMNGSEVLRFGALTRTAS